MTSRGSPSANLSTSFAPSSWSSALGVAEAIASYRRSQYIITEQNVASSVESDSHPEDLEGQSDSDEALQVSDEEEPDDDLTPMPRDEEPAMMSSLQWDEDVERPVQTVSRPVGPLFRRPPGRWRQSEHRPRPSASVPQASPLVNVSEQTPLLLKATSKSSLTLQLPRPQREGEWIEQNAAAEEEGSGAAPRRLSEGKARLARKLSSASTRSEKQLVGGRSTFGQTLFNSIAILLGFGMLSEPLAFAYAGWIGGTLLVVLYGLITCYTAKILAHIMITDPQIRTYADIGNKAFGQRSRFLTSSLFCLELFSVSVVLVTLYADSLHSIVPTYPSDTYKIFGLIILIPSVFVPLSVLSYASILGIMSTLLIIAVLLFDGLSKPTSPGSLWSPAHTSLSIASWGELGVAFGLIMAGFSGHAVLPSLARDMSDPRDFDKMINWAFVSATVIYFVIGGSGYLMFGNSVSDEVSNDLLATPGYNVFLNKLAVWSLVIMPLTKFALTTRPVNITLEIMFGIEASSLPDVHGHDVPSAAIAVRPAKRSRFLMNTLIFLERSVFACLAVAVSIFIPEFSAMMAFLGSFSAFLLCVIGPISAKAALAGRCSLGDALLLLVGVIMTAWGTVAAFAA